MAPDDDERKTQTYQVWHATNPLAHLAFSKIHDIPEPQFPQDYRHVATVAACDLDHAFQRTNIGDSDSLASWHENPGVKLIANDARSTSVGDVIVDPQGAAHRVEWEGFRELDAPEPDPPEDRPLVGEEAKALYREWTEDYAAAEERDRAGRPAGRGPIADEREALVRLTFEKMRDILYHKFSEEFSTAHAAVQKYPEPARREEAMRGFWVKDYERMFPGYQGVTAGASVDDLKAHDATLDRMVASHGDRAWELAVDTAEVLRVERRRAELETPPELRSAGKPGRRRDPLAKARQRPVGLGAVKGKDRGPER